VPIFSILLSRLKCLPNAFLDLYPSKLFVYRLYFLLLSCYLLTYHFDRRRVVKSAIIFLMTNVYIFITISIRQHEMFSIRLVYLMLSQKMIAHCILPYFHLLNALRFLYLVSVLRQPIIKIIKFNKNKML